jgi:hypothetical protein
LAFGFVGCEELGRKAMEEGKMMGKISKRENLFLVLAIAITVCFGHVGAAKADTYIIVSVPSSIDLGSIATYGNHVLTPPAFKIRIESDSSHHVELSLSDLTHNTENSIISPANFTTTPIMSSPVATPLGGIEVNVNMQFDITTTSAELAGGYSGTLTVTVMPGP